MEHRHDPGPGRVTGVTVAGVGSSPLPRPGVSPWQTESATHNGALILKQGYDTFYNVGCHVSVEPKSESAETLTSFLDILSIFRNNA
jgi:hypothetical protein